MMTLISWVYRIYGLVHVISIFSYCCRKLHKMHGNILKSSGKVREFYLA